MTTRGVLLEVGNSLARARFRGAAAKLLVAVEADPQFVIVPLTDDLYARALAPYTSRPAKEWGLVDCVSFTVMGDRGITDALTADGHFVRAGFRALLREPA